MPLMEWTDKLSVGHPGFDAEHRRLVDMINDLFDAVQEGRSRDILGVIIDDLIDYTESHFAHEEEVMDKVQYPERQHHQHEHQILCLQVNEIRRKYLTGAGATLSMEVMNFLKNWLVTHIQQTDRRFGRFVNESRKA